MNKWIMYVAGALCALLLTSITFSPKSTSQTVEDNSPLEVKIKVMSPKNQLIVHDILNQARYINNSAQVYRDTHSK